LIQTLMIAVSGKAFDETKKTNFNGSFVTPM
jgi:hypothetical protein